jgi:hypothetical protein
MATKNQTTAVQTTNPMMMVSDAIPDFLKGQTGARGSENVGAADLVIPRLELVQDLSPCRKKADPSYIPGCEEGMLYNNVTRQLYGTEILVVPVYFRKEWLIWKHRIEGGGFRGAFATQDAAEVALESLEDGDKCEVTDTAQHFCLLINSDGRVEEIVISMNKSKMKVSRKLNSLIRMNEGDSFSRVYKIGTTSEKNSKNQDYFNLTVAPGGFPTQELYKKAESLYEAIKDGTVSIDRRTDEPAAGGSGEY